MWRSCALGALLLGVLGCEFHVTGLPIGGGAPDLATPAVAPPDLAAPVVEPPDLADRADLAALPGPTPDLAPAGSPDLALVDQGGCLPPSLQESVGPGPNLGIVLSKVKLNGGTNFATVAPGASFTLRADYELKDNGCCVDQIIVGTATTPQACLFDGKVFFPGSSGNRDVTLTAPTAPGLYTLRFHYGQAFKCDLGWWTVQGAPTSSVDFAALCVR